MDIKQKLAYFTTTQDKMAAVPVSDSAISSSLQALLEHFEAEIVAPQAPYLKISRDFIPEQKRIEGNEQADPKINISLLTKGEHPASFNLSDCLFFDLESTGLMGGSGTFAFLLGFGYFTQNRLIIDQYFLPDFGREYYLFKALNEWFEKFRYLISFNGKSFDFPLMRTRFIMNQIKPGFLQMSHIDLMHLARRVWKNCLTSCDLIAIESNILLRQRPEDIPGWAIPQSYFTFLRTGIIHDIIQIIEHNYNDIVSLAEILLMLDRINTHPESITEPSILVSLATLAYDLEEIELFNKLYSFLKINGKPTDSRLSVLKSLLHKKQGQWTAAVLLWEELIHVKDFSFFALEELAKYFEHQLKDFRKALEYTERALSIIENLVELEYKYPNLYELREKFTNRKNRLRLKLA